MSRLRLDARDVDLLRQAFFDGLLESADSGDDVPEGLREERCDVHCFRSPSQLLHVVVDVRLKGIGDGGSTHDSSSSVGDGAPADGGALGCTSDPTEEEAGDSAAARSVSVDEGFSAVVESLGRIEALLEYLAHPPGSRPVAVPTPPASPLMGDAASTSLWKPWRR